LHVKGLRQIISGGSVDTAAISRRQTDRIPKFINAWKRRQLATGPGGVSAAGRGAAIAHCLRQVRDLHTVVNKGTGGKDKTPV
jgi:hypothetical protein